MNLLRSICLVYLKYRNNYHALTLGNKILADKLTQTCANLEIQHGDIGEDVPFGIPNTIKCPMLEKVAAKVHNWETNDIKSKCFDYCELYTAYQIKENLGADAGIIPLYHDKKAIYAQFQR